ncbi:MAG TPA: hypothetical protein EYH02_06075 [Ignisphaera aggregans]|uniref:Nmd3 N-terminal domain-containing protein n=1 Tax=Ignisphaera aggregans TaxID=334771 RepID=A0A833DV79_9CREN|nr:hypothetical protein [Ignisphaera aggregans]
MPKYARFCIRCGKVEDENNVLINNLCPNCYIEIYGIARLDKPLRIIHCPRCYSIKIGDKWLRPNTQEELYSLIQAAIAESLQPATSEITFIDLTLKSVELYSPTLELEITASISNKVVVKHRLPVSVSWHKQLCPSCFKRAGKGYDAVVQLRYINYDSEIERFKNWLVEMFAEDIVEIDEHKNGYDIKVSNQFVARKIVNFIRRKWSCVKIIESYGDQRRRRDGRRYGRLYISVRILNFKPGDYIVLGGKAYIVDSVDEHSLTIIDSNGNRIRMNIKDMIKMYAPA